MSGATPCSRCRTSCLILQSAILGPADTGQTQRKLQEQRHQRQKARSSRGILPPLAVLFGHLYTNPGADSVALRRFSCRAVLQQHDVMHIVVEKFLAMSCGDGGLGLTERCREPLLRSNCPRDVGSQAAPYAGVAH